MLLPSNEEIRKNQKWQEKKENAEEVTESIINHIQGEKYVHPRDENERGFNRGIDLAVDTIETNFIS